MCRCDLRSQQRQLRVVEQSAGHGPEVDGEVGRRDGRDEGGYVEEGAVEGGDGGVVEVVAGRDGLDLVQGGVACADDGDGAEGELIGRVDGGEPAARLSKLTLAREVIG